MCGCAGVRVRSAGAGRVRMKGERERVKGSTYVKPSAAESM